MSDHCHRFRTLVPRWILLVSTLLLIGGPNTAWSAENVKPAVPNRPPPTTAEAPTPVEIRTAWSADGIRFGDTVILAVIFNIQKGYHINADAGQLRPMEGFQPVPTRVAVSRAPLGLRLEAVRYPRAKAVKVAFAQGELMAFEDRTIVYLPMTLVTAAAPGKIRIGLQVDYQACDDRICLFPRQVPIETALPVVDAVKETIPLNRPLFADYSTVAETVVSGRVDFDLFGWDFSLTTGSWWGFAVLLMVAGIGGFLLNFTPCVLPLIPIKIISLSNASQDQSRCLALGLTMFLGVLGFWLALGAAIAVVAEFTATNQLFQYPLFTISIGVIIAVMALGMCGLFSVRLPSFVYNIHPNQETLHGSFLLGILTAILSTPCTAPFMGAAAAWAATQHPLTTLTTFVSIGTGMAFPYLVLSACPTLVGKMPRTGPASVLIKQVMGLFMLAAAAYFIGTGVSGLLVQPPNPPGLHYWWAVVMFLAAGGGWLAVRAVQIASGRVARTFLAGLGLLILVGSIFGGLRLTDKGPVDWVPYTPEQFRKAVGRHQVVVMVFTAEWCLNCKALEQGVLNSPKVAAMLAAEDVVPMKVDITGNNRGGKEKLRELGHLTIPLLVVFAKTGEEVFRSDFYTVEQVVEAVTGARSAAATDSVSTAG